MNLNKPIWAALGVVALSTSLMACDEGEDVDHRVAQQAVGQNVTNVSASVSNSMVFLKGSSLFNDGFGRAFGGYSDCGAPPYNDDNTYEDDYDYDCGGEPAKFDPDFSEPTAEAVSYLSNYIFTQKNVESESGNSVTYLLKGEVVCPAFDNDGPSCINNFKALQIRLVVTSPAAGDVDISVQVGPNRINPVNLEFYRNHLAASPDLAAIRSTILFSAQALNQEAPKLPTMQGRLRLAIARDGDKKASASVAITHAILVADGDYEFQAAASPNALVVTTDGVAKMVSASAALGAISALFTTRDDSYSYEDYDENGDVIYVDSEGSDPVAYGVKLGGLSASSIFDATKELLNVTNIGLGSTTSTLDINGKRVLSVDLNKDNGRKFDLSIEKTGDNPTLTVSPAFDLRLVLKFAQVQDQLRNVAEWALDEVLTINLSGAAKPSVQFLDDGIKVLAGKLTLTAATAGLTHVVEANQCLVQEFDSREPTSCIYDEILDDCIYEDDGSWESEPERHPLSELIINSCN
ncbi:MAG: hypothetical protein H0U74_07305 [Bradymonadaceae bacterium]|nr:hypothetical protein [Lujinxingiaceae bacterium]